MMALLIDDSRNASTPLTWQTPVSSIIRDDFVLPDEYATAHVTIEDALSHRTGMPRHDASYGGPNWTVKDVARNLRHLSMTAEIRQKFQYCNMMFMTLSHVIETLTGKWLGDSLSERLWKPLSMTRTYFSLEQVKAAVDTGDASLAQGYQFNNVTGEYSAVEALDLTEISGAGAVVSNVLDYTKWLRFLINQSLPLSEAGHNALRTPRINIPIPPKSATIGIGAYALGWEVVDYHGEPLIMHDGGLPGYGAKVGYFPRQGFGFALMGNTAATSNAVAEILSYRLMDEKLRVPVNDRVSGKYFFEDIIKERAEKLRHPRRSLYPDAPEEKDSVPLTLPLDAYTGVYFNPGYRNVTILLSDETMIPLSSGHSKTASHLSIHDKRTWPWTFEFNHVSGEYFYVLAYMDVHNGTVPLDDPLQVEALKTEFRIGVDGHVSEFGARIEPEMGDEKIWFKKVA